MFFFFKFRPEYYIKKLGTGEGGGRAGRGRGCQLRGLFMVSEYLCVEHMSVL